MEKVISVETMRSSDSAEIARLGSGLGLMFNAGKAVFESVEWHGRVAVVCGSGNNGGDGYVIAMLLNESGVDCEIFRTSEKLSEDGAYYYNKCVEAGIKSVLMDAESDLRGFDFIVDCILGTGFKGAARGIPAIAIEKINSSSAYVVSVDINSGLNGDSGMTEGCVKSDLTVSVGTYKTGHFLNMAKDCIGGLKNADIGIPIIGDCCYLPSEGDFGSVVRPRSNHSHKGTYGYVALIGGCTEYSGAMKLANMACAAMRAGCGVARLVAPESISTSVAPYLLESTLYPVPDRDGKMLYDPESLDKSLSGIKAAAVGMGWGRSGDYESILRQILERYDIPLIIDADAINTLADMDRSLIKNTRCRLILTPHLKEFERLSGYSVAETMDDPVGAAKAFAREYGHVLLLKGTSTVVTDGEIVYIVDRGCPGMATGGSGDVLSGILAGLCGYNDADPLTAACGAYISGRAGELAQKNVNPVSMTAGDTVGFIAPAVSEIIGGSHES